MTLLSSEVQNDSIRLLIIDDEEDVLKATRDYLTLTFSFVIDMSGSGEDALVKIAKTRYDVIIVDYEMKDMNGIDLLKTIRAGNDDTPEKIREYIIKAEEATQRIEATIGFTREYEEFGVASSGWQAVYSIIESAKREINAESIIISNYISPSLEVFADPIIRKVFSTLLENAVRHGITITSIRFSAIEKNNDLIIICEDDGAGIPVGKKVQIFGMGYGNHTGIGLFLAREILSITDLSIREVGEEGKGARFEIFVPEGKWRE
ncbi:response regulator [Methanospirillum sp.]|uniref:ATP-binding response regulator n=1 Tax=Methanospirillum sp. TaxID=45200 RepID=UPI0035A05B53